MPMYQIPKVEGRILYKSIEFFKYELQNCKKISFAKVLIDQQCIGSVIHIHSFSITFISNVPLSKGLQMRRLDLISIRKKTSFDSLYLYIIMELHHITMLQKLSKCEVKAWLCCNLIFLPLLRFYVKSNRIQRVQVIKFDFSIFEQLSSPKLPKIQCSESLKCYFWTA